MNKINCKVREKGAFIYYYKPSEPLLRFESCSRINDAKFLRGGGFKKINQDIQYTKILIKR